MAFVAPLSVYHRPFSNVSSNVKCFPKGRSTQQHGKRQAWNVWKAKLDVLVVGAETRVGANLASRLIKGSGNRISCLYSPADTDEARHAKRSVANARGAGLYREDTLDITNSAAVTDTLASLKPNTVVSCIGGDASAFVPGSVSPYEDAAFRDLPAAKSVVDACVAAKIEKLVFVSMLGAGDSEASVPLQVMASLRPLLLDMSDAEAYIRRSSGLNWTIVRPAPMEEDDEDDGSDGAMADGGLLDRVIITEDVDIYGTVTVDLFANALAHIVSSNNVAAKTLHVVNRQRILITSPYVRPLEPWENMPVTPAVL